MYLLGKNGMKSFFLGARITQKEKPGL